MSASVSTKRTLSYVTFSWRTFFNVFRTAAADDGDSVIRKNVVPIQILWTPLKKKIELKEPAAQITITFVKFVKSVSTNILLSGKKQKQLTGNIISRNF